MTHMQFISMMAMGAVWAFARSNMKRLYFSATKERLHSSWMVVPIFTTLVLIYIVSSCAMVGMFVKALRPITRAESTSMQQVK